MRKLVPFLFAFLMIFSMILNVSAAEGDTKPESTTPFDPFNEKNALAIYNVHLPYTFSTYNNIDDILASNAVLEITYRAIDENSEVYYWTYRNGNYYTFSTSEVVSERALKIIQDTELIKAIDKDIVVDRVYYISGETHYHGSAIYYVTNMGDFVCYVHYNLGEDEFLFPVEDFCRYQKALYDFYASWGDSDGGGDITGVWDLSKYNVNSDSFAPLSHTGNTNESPVGDSETETLESEELTEEPSKPTGKYLWIIIASAVAIAAAIGLVIYLVKKPKETTL